MRKLDEQVLQELLKPFQASEVRIRTSPYVAAYITARVVQTRLNEVLAFQWSFTLIGEGRFDSNGVLHQDGALILHAEDGRDRVYQDRGSAAADPGKGQAKQAKAAVSDCFKRCAVPAGVGRYLYELQGVQAGRIPKSSLEKALAAVGYRGPWDDRHHGSIGGIREADAEDDEVSGGHVDVPPAPQGNGAARGVSKPAALRPAPAAETDEPLATPDQQEEIMGVLEAVFPDLPARKAYYLDKLGKKRVGQITQSEYWDLAADLRERLNPTMAEQPLPDTEAGLFIPEEEEDTDGRPPRTGGLEPIGKHLAAIKR